MSNPINSLYDADRGSYLVRYTTFEVITSSFPDRNHVDYICPTRLHSNLIGTSCVAQTSRKDGSVFTLVRSSMRATGKMKFAKMLIRSRYVEFREPMPALSWVCQRVGALRNICIRFSFDGTYEDPAKGIELDSFLDVVQS